MADVRTFLTQKKREIGGYGLPPLSTRPSPVTTRRAPMGSREAIASEIIRGSRAYQQSFPQVVARRPATVVEDIHLPELTWYDKIKDVRSNPAQLVPFLASGREAMSIVGLLAAANRVKDGKEKPGDLDVLKEYIEKESVDKSFGYKVLDVVSMLQSFAGELYATAGMATAGRVAATRGAKEGLKF